MLQRQGPFVLLLDGTTPTRAMQLADETWKNLESETEFTVIPFDFRQRSFSIVFEKKIAARLSLYSPFPDQLFQVCLNGKLRNPL